MPKRDNRFQGLLVVDKPGLPCPIEKRKASQERLPTSHDIVQKVRRWSGQRRIGHTGTLDPMASGVLVLCLGAATRLVEYYQGHDKQYRARVTLGAATDTYDAMGKITHSSSIQSLSTTQIETQLDRFRGEILQTPPAFSAIKQGGESLHRKARRGENVRPEPRSVTIHRLQLCAYRSPDTLELQITCSAGTYIRSLAHDIGRALNTFAHLSYLRRLAAGPFTLADAHTLAAIEQAAVTNTLDRCLLPLGHGLRMPHLQLDVDEIVRLGYGQQVVSANSPTSGPDLPVADPSVSLPEGLLVQVSDADGNFAGIARNMGLADQESGNLWKAEKWFLTS